MSLSTWQDVRACIRHVLQAGSACIGPHLNKHIVERRGDFNRPPISQPACCSQVVISSRAVVAPAHIQHGGHTAPASLATHTVLPPKSQRSTCAWPAHALLPGRVVAVFAQVACTPAAPPSACCGVARRSLLDDSRLPRSANSMLPGPGAGRPPGDSTRPSSYASLSSSSNGSLSYSGSPPPVPHGLASVDERMERGVLAARRRRNAAPLAAKRAVSGVAEEPLRAEVKPPPPDVACTVARGVANVQLRADAQPGPAHPPRELHGLDVHQAASPGARALARLTDAPRSA
eukprot:349801-Chlamydomonas_euryale.AAC.54